MQPLCCIADMGTCLLPAEQHLLLAPEPKAFVDMQAFCNMECGLHWRETSALWGRHAAWTHANLDDVHHPGSCNGVNRGSSGNGGLFCGTLLSKSLSIANHLRKQEV